MKPIDKQAKGVDLDSAVSRLGPRWFLMRDAHSSDGTVLLQPRWALSYLRGPMTRSEIRQATGATESR